MNTSTITPSEQYDWTEDNYPTVASIRMSKWHQLKKEGMQASRAANAASDYVAGFIMHPPKTGAELDSWMGQQAHKRRAGKDEKRNGNGHAASHNGNGNGNGYAAPEPTGNGMLAETVPFSIPTGLTPPNQKVDHKTKKWEPVFAVLKSGEIGQWIPLMFTTERDAKDVCGVLYYHARVALQCEQNGWRVRSKKDKGNVNLVWIIKEKIEK